jgi:hypothetical protein
MTSVPQDHKPVFIRQPGFIIIGGTGRDSGKSSLAEMLIRRFASRGVTGIKITPHFHPDLSGLSLLADGEGFKVYEESNRSSDKDSARMLRAGATRVILIVAGSSSVAEAFSAVLPLLSRGMPVVCESPALRRLVHPDLFIIMIHGQGGTSDRKNIDDLLPLADLTLTIDDLQSGKTECIDLDEYSSWYLKRQ